MVIKQSVNNFYRFDHKCWHTICCGS